MELKYEKEASDARGTILFLSYGDRSVNLVEIKKGFSRGGHYHEFETVHFILSGKIEYRQKDVESGLEMTQIISAPHTICIPAKAAHLLTAIEDTLFVEEFSRDYSATEYPEYRNMVRQKMA